MFSWFFQRLTIELVNQLLVLFLILFVGIGGLLYWQDLITANGWVLVTLMAIVIGFLSVLGARVGQKDGFIDGFKRGKDSR